MKDSTATDAGFSHDYYVLQFNGRIDSTHRRYEDALRAGLQLKYRFPHDDIKVCEITSEQLHSGNWFVPTSNGLH